MGLDLVLLPFDGVDFSHTILNCDRNREQFAALLEKQSKFGRDVPEGFRCYLSVNESSGDICYGVITEDYYGEPLKYLTAKQLLDCFKSTKRESLGIETLAILVYLESVQPDRKVALMWK